MNPVNFTNEKHNPFTIERSATQGIDISRFDIWFASALAAAIFFRLFRLGDAALWFDEIFTATWVRLPWGEMLHTAFADNHLPLYFLLLKGWTLLAGTSPVALRIPSVVFSWMMVPLIAGIAWTIKDKIAARWAAWFTALSPYLLQHAQEARMYPLLGVLAAANTLLLARFLSGRSERLGSAFLCINAALLATHYYSVFFVGAEFLTLLVLASRRWRYWAPMMTISFFLIAGPMLAAKYLATPHAGGSYEIGLFALPGMLWALLGGYTLLPSSEELHAQGLRAAITYLPLAFAACAALCVLLPNTLRSLSKMSLLLLVTIIGAVVLGPFAIGLFFDVGTNPRYAITCFAAVIALIAAGAPAAKHQRLRLSAAITVMAIMVIGSTLHLANPGHGREDVRAIGEWLDTNVPRDEEILVTSGEMTTMAQFHWPQRKFKTYPAEKTVVHKDNARQIAEGMPFSTSSQVIYMFGRAWLSDPEGVLQTALKKNYRACPGTQARGIEILCFTRAASK